MMRKKKRRKTVARRHEAYTADKPAPKTHRHTQWKSKCGMEMMMKAGMLSTVRVE